MFAAYFQHCKTKADAQKTRRNLAKQFHPDLGGDEEKMKLLTNEYEETLKRLDARNSEQASVVMEINERIESCLRRFGITTLPDVFPDEVIEIILEPGVEPGQVLKIEAELRRELQQYGAPFLLVYWGVRKSRPYKIYTHDCVTYIDIMDAEKTYDHQVKLTGNCEKALYQTYAAYAHAITYGDKWYAAHWDNKLNHGYLMHCSKTLTLNDLLRTS